MAFLLEAGRQIVHHLESYGVNGESLLTHLEVRQTSVLVTMGAS